MSIQTRQRIVTTVNWGEQVLSIKVMCGTWFTWHRYAVLNVKRLLPLSSLMLEGYLRRAMSLHPSITSQLQKPSIVGLKSLSLTMVSPPEASYPTAYFKP